MYICVDIGMLYVQVYMTLGVLELDVSHSGVFEGEWYAGMLLSPY